MTYPAPSDVQYLGEWSHGRGTVGLFFLKIDTNNDNIYHFVNPKNAWVVFPNWFTNPTIHERFFKRVFYDKLEAFSAIKPRKTPFFYKKKENLERYFEKLNATTGNRSGTITGFSRDTVPAGILSGESSKVTIYGDGFGTIKGSVVLEDANQTNIPPFVALHPQHHILFWSDDSIQIIVPSMGYASTSTIVLGNTIGACAGTGIVSVVINPSASLPTFIDSPMPIVVPYAVANHATNSAFENLYTPHEVRLRNANGQGGYTFVYDTSFYNNTAALTAFRRALKTWRCATGIHFKELCGENTFCKTDESSTRVLVS